MVLAMRVASHSRAPPPIVPTWVVAYTRMLVPVSRGTEPWVLTTRTVTQGFKLLSV